MLSACRVLDLTDERGQLAGMVLAQLGADVIAVEPPGGARSRHLEPSPALHLAYNRGKRSVVFDLAEDADRGRFLDLVTTADSMSTSAVVTRSRKRPRSASWARSNTTDRLPRL